MALDADEPGRKAAQEAIEIAKRHLVPVVEFTDHLDAGVKDLHKLLMLKGALKESASLKEEFLPAAGRDALWAELSECCFL